ncbi:cytochrome c, partial [Bacillus sp. OA1]|nr:cytochrome c [Bacillus sp. OA1]
GGAAAPALQNLTLKPEEIAKIAKEGKGSMPKGVFKGTDEELKKLSEFVAKYNKK